LPGVAGAAGNPSAGLPENAARNRRSDRVPSVPACLAALAEGGASFPFAELGSEGGDESPQSKKIAGSA
jgi:hypothetical protein